MADHSLRLSFIRRRSLFLATTKHQQCAEIDIATAPRNGVIVVDARSIVDQDFCRRQDLSVHLKSDRKWLLIRRRNVDNEYFKVSKSQSIIISVFRS